MMEQMSLQRAIEILERQRRKGRLNDTNHISSIISMLDSPVFQGLLDVQTLVSDPSSVSPLPASDIHVHIDPADDISEQQDNQIHEESSMPVFSSYVSSQPNETDYETTLESLAQRRHIETITLNKVPDTSLGFSVVKTILPGGVADINGRLRSGDHILYINDVNVRGMTSEQVASVLRQSGSHVRLIIARCLLEPPLVQEAAAPVIPTNQLDEQLANLFISDSQDQLDCVGLSGSESTSPMGAPPNYYLSDVDIHNSNNSKTAETQMFDVSLEKDNTGLGITIAGVISTDGSRDELCGIFVKGITDDSPAARDGRIRVNDQICEVDNRSLWGCTNQEAVEVLRLTGHTVKLKMVRYLRGAKYEQLMIHQGQVAKDTPFMNHVSPSIVNGPQETNTPISQGFNVIKPEDEKDENDNNDFFNYDDEDFNGDLRPEVDTTIKACWEPIIGDDFDVVVAQLSKFQESAGLGISLEGTVDIENGVEVRPHHYIRAILQHGPVGMNGKLKTGDELLEVNGKRILGLNHVNVVAILKKLPKNVRIVCARRRRPMSEISATDNSTTDQFSSSSFSMGVKQSYDRMVKSKSDMMLAGEDVASLNTKNKAKSRSLEPLTGLAVWSPEPVIIELVKGDKGLGFSILDYKDPLNQSDVVIVIRSLVPGGVAQLDGRLIPGDRLVFVNDIDLENATLDQAVQALKGAQQGIVRIGVAKPLPVSQNFYNQENEFGSDEQISNDINYNNNRHDNFHQSELILPQSNINLAHSPTHSSSSTNSDSDIEVLKSRLKREQHGSFSSSSTDDDDPRTLNATSNNTQIKQHRLPTNGQISQNHSHDTESPPIKPPPPIHVNHKTSLNDAYNRVSHNNIVVAQSLAQNDVKCPQNEVVTASVPIHTSSHNAADSCNKSQPRDKPALPPKPLLLQTVKSKHTTDSNSQSGAMKAVGPETDGLIRGKMVRSSPPMKPIRKRPPSSEWKKSPTSSWSASSSFDSKESPPPPIASTSPPLPSSSPSPLEPKPSPPQTKPSPILPHVQPTKLDDPIQQHETRISTDSSTSNTSHEHTNTPLEHTSIDHANTSDLKGISVQTTPRSLSPAMSPSTSPRVTRTLSGSSVETLPSSLEQTIKITKGHEPLGMTLEVVDKGVNGCVVKSLSPGGSVVNDGHIQVGDYITNLNYENLKRITNAQAHAVMRRASLLSSTFIRITYISGENVAAHQASEHNSPSHIHYPTMTSPKPSLSPVHKQRVSPLSSPIRSHDTSPLSMTPDLISALSTTPDLTSSDHLTLSTSEAVSPFFSPTPPPLPHSAPPSLPNSQNTPLVSSQNSDISTSFQSSVFDGSITPLHASTELSQTVRLNKVEGPPLISEHAWGPPRQVQLTRLEGQSLGISIVGGRADALGGALENVISGIFIKHVLPDSPAGENGTLKTGDRIIEVNGNDLTDATHDQAVEVIRNAKNPVQFTIQSLVDSSCPSDQDVDRRSVDSSKEGPIISSSSHNITQEQRDPPPVPEVNEDDAVSSSDDDDVDEYGYSVKKLQRKYGELPGELHLIELEHGGNGLGLSLAGNKDRGTMSTFIAGLQPDSAADVDGRLHIGDELLEVNGQTLHGRSHLNASAIIKGQSSPVIKIVLLRRDDALEQMAVKPLRLSPTLPLEHEAPITPSMHNDVKASPVREINIVPPSTTTTPDHTPLPGSYDTVTTVTLHKKGSTGLGLAISEGNSHGKPGIFVKSLTPDGTAEKDGNLQIDDQILEVDDHSLINVDYEKAISILRNSKGHVKLTVSKCGDRSLPTPKLSVINIDAPGESSSDPLDETTRDNDDPGTCKIAPGVETTIEIEKGRKGLGLSIVGGADTLLGAIIIHEVYEDGAAAKDGRLKQGDNIMDVNYEDLRNVSHERAIQVLRQTPPTVRMTVFRDDIQLKDDLLDVFSIELLKKPGKGLGISIVGKRNDVGVYISDVVKGGLAESDGRLMQGDQILSVNDTDFRQASQDQAAVLLKTLMGKITMTIGRLKAGSKASSRRNSGGAGSSAVHKSNSSASSKSRNKHSKKIRDIRNNTIRTVKLERDTAGSLGLSIAGGDGSPMGDVPVVIADINPEGPAARCAKLKIGDYILSINGVITDGMSHTDAVKLLKNCASNLTLKVVHGEELAVNINNGTSRQTSMDLTPVPIGPIDVDYSNEAVRTIVLHKGSEGLGFTIVGGFGSPHGDLPIYVKNVFSKGAAADGHDLKRGDQIVSVCGINLEGLTHEQAVEILKQTKGKVTLEIVS